MTIRQHLEALGADVSYDFSLSAEEVVEILEAVICAHQEHAVAALDKLDSYVLDQSTSIDFRLVPDPVAAATPPVNLTDPDAVEAAIKRYKPSPPSGT